jgi:nucleoside-diphosphate-sugar epimerase
MKMTPIEWRQLSHSVLIIGSGGFLGNHLVKKFTTLGFDVLSLSRKSGDLTATETWQKLNFEQKKIDFVFFCAEKTGNEQFFEKHSSFDILINNYSILKNFDLLLSQFLESCHVFVFGSLWTAQSQKKDITEEDLFDYEGESVASSLQLTKIMLKSFVDKTNESTIHTAQIITTGTLFGPGDKSGHLIPSFLAKLKLAKKKIHMDGAGNAMRNFIYIEDFSDMLLMLIRYELFQPRSLILTSNVNLDIKSLINSLAEKCGSFDVIWKHGEGAFSYRTPSLSQMKGLHFQFNELSFTSPDDFSREELLRW